MPRRRVPQLTPVFVLALSALLAGCGPRGAVTGMPPTPRVPTATPAASGPALVFTSDRSIILPAASSTYQFVAGIQSGASFDSGAVTWSSSNPSVVSVDAGGKVTALAALGSATIMVSVPGYDPDTASVVIAPPGPHTVIVPSTDVISASDTSVTLVKNTLTSSLVPDAIVVSGDRGGLLNRVVSVNVGASTVSLTTVPASLAAAFSRLQIDIRGVPAQAKLRVTRGRATITANDGRLLADTSASKFTCTIAAGAAGAVDLSGPSITAPVSWNLHALLVGSGFSIQTFALVAEVTIPLNITTGTVSFSGGGTVLAHCTTSLPTLRQRVLGIGPLVIKGTVTQQIGIDVAGTVSETTSATGPNASVTVNASDGVQYVNGSWQAVEDNRITGSVQAGTATARGALTAQLSPFYRADPGIEVIFYGYSVGQANLAFVEGGADFNLAINEPLTPSDPGYTGPVWTGGIHGAAGPDLIVTPDSNIASLFQRLGVTVPAPNVQWTKFSQSKTLIGSPIVNATAAQATGTTCDINLGATVTDDNPSPIDHSGDTVRFTTLSGPMAPTVVGTGKVAGASAHADWNVRIPGPYTVRALLSDTVFGAVDLPYPSPVETIAGPACPTARLVGVHFGDTATADGVFRFDPLALTVFDSTVVLSEPDRGYNFALNDPTFSEIRYFRHGGIEFVVGSYYCATCNGAGILLAMPAIPKTSGTYDISCACRDQTFDGFSSRVDIDIWNSFSNSQNMEESYMDGPAQMVVSYPPSPGPLPKVQNRYRQRPRATTP